VSSILWRREDGLGLERCVIEPSAEGWRIAGTTLLVADDIPTEIRYSVLTDQEWRTRTVGAHVQSPTGDRRMALIADGAGSWFSNDQPIIDLYGAMDVDLAWTPATNTLPIRRLDLAIGEGRDVAAAWVGFPEHTVVRLTQHYERLDHDTYRYAAGELSVDLTVDSMGRVLRYPDGWETIAETSGR
jgi:uncharacterized protein